MSRRLADIPHFSHIAATIHPGLPEDEAVFAQRIRVYPAGCLGLVDPDVTTTTGSDELCGYAISHPIRWREPPALNALLPEDDDDDDDEERARGGKFREPASPLQYYIHDLAILPAYRGHGLARLCVEKVLAHARECGFRTTALVSVYRTKAFWGRLGFRSVEGAEVEGRYWEEREGKEERGLDMEEKVKGSYGEGAVRLERVERVK